MNDIVKEIRKPLTESINRSGRVEGGGGFILFLKIFLQIFIIFYIKL